MNRACGMYGREEKRREESSRLSMRIIIKWIL
jgi:hypothetical protein